MSNNSDQNTRVSAEPEDTALVPSDPPTPAPGAEAPEPAPHLASLLKEAEDEAARLKDAWLRSKAETDNMRKQAQNDLAKAHKYAIERFAQELLDRARRARARRLRPRTRRSRRSRTASS